MMSELNEARNDGASLAEYLRALGLYKKPVALAVLSCTALVLLISLLLPNIYTAQTKILASDQSGDLFAALGNSFVADLAGISGIIPERPTIDLYIDMLKSRTISDQIIDAFNLQEIYGQKSRMKTRETLNEKVSFFASQDSGIITISVEDKDPQRAADIAKAFVASLQNLNLQLNQTSASREREFLEERLGQVRENLAAAEDALRAFEEKHQAIKLDEQTQALVKAIAKLKAEIVSREIELGVLLTYTTEQNPEVVSLKEHINQLRQQLKAMDDDKSTEAFQDEFSLSPSVIPRLGLDYLRLLRQFKIQETLNEILTKQYEMAKIAEAKSVSSIQVLDEAIPPDKKSKPRRTLLVVFFACFFFFLSVLFVFVKVSIEHLPENKKAMWRDVVSAFKLRRGKG